MFKKEMPQDPKYKVLLVAYKELAKDMEEKLAYYFISSVKSREELEKGSSSNERSLAGLSFRTGLYHKWFKETILQKLNEGYKLGIVEIPKSYGDNQEVLLKELDEEFGDNILIVATEEL